MTNAEKVVSYLRTIAPRAASNSDIGAHAGVRPHQQVFQITQRLMTERRIQGRQRGHEWEFWCSVSDKTAPEQGPKAEIPLQSKDLSKQFDDAMLKIYQRAKSEAGYNATIFFRMISDRGGLATAKYLINSPKPSDGYTHLYERGRLDLTVEAMVVENEKWHSLFRRDELDKALHRLEQYGYKRSDVLRK